MESASSGLVIDWHLLLLQAGNFLFLLAVLTFLVWKPLIKMVDDRRKLIAEGIEAAKLQKKAAAAAESDREKLLADARKQASKIVAETRDELRAERQALKEEMTKERQQFSKSLEKELEGSRAKLRQEVKDQTAELVVAAVEKVLVAGANEKDLSAQVAKVLSQKD